MFKDNNSLSLVILFLNFLLICAILLENVDGRADDDTELSNTSFQYLFVDLLGEGQTCYMRLKWDEDTKAANAKVVEPFKMPTCLKVSHIIFFII
jgi:hypothetical protein